MILQDNSGTIEREEFLSLPQINSNPLATRYVLPKAGGIPHQAKPLDSLSYPSHWFPAMLRY